VKKPKVYVTRQIAEEALDAIARAAELEVWPEPLPPPYAVVAERAREADGLLTLLTDRVDAALMDAAPGLKVVSNLAVGYDNIDVAEASRRSIAVGNTPGVLTATTADLAFALLMAAARRVVEADRYTRAGRWQTWGPQTLLGQDLHGATLGIVGLGRIGVEMARRARGFGMQILYCDAVRRSEEESALGVAYVPELETLLSRADFVSLHVPLLPETRHLISTAELAAMKPSAVLVNTSRGAIVDQRALHEALASRQIGADPRRRPAAEPGQPRHHSAHRERELRHTQEDGPHGRREPPRRPARRGSPPLRESRGSGTALRPLSGFARGDPRSAGAARSAMGDQKAKSEAKRFPEGPGRRGS
jgi:glyoxylate reductase